MIHQAAKPGVITCEHKETRIRRKTGSDGREMFAKQCLRCGSKMGDWIPRRAIFGPDSLEQWDDQLYSNWLNRLNEQNRKLREDKNAEWWAFYQSYMQSEEWREKRRLVMKRAKNVCEGCGIQHAVHVHHLTYCRLGHEMLFDLVAVCKECHETIHGRVI